MKLVSFLALSSIIATSAYAEETRQLDAHEHGVGQLDIAVDGTQIAMELHAPGADIVGFEYAAESAEDRSAVDKAIATLAKPLDLFVIGAAAGCSVETASAELESEDSHDDHDDHGDDHADEKHDDHADDDHSDEKHDDHDHKDHEEEGHDDHADEAGHTEFHAEYLLTCTDPSAVTDITFAYFAAFPNALEVEVQMITDSGATSFEVERDTPVLDLRGMF